MLLAKIQYRARPTNLKSGTRCADDCEKPCETADSVSFIYALTKECSELAPTYRHSEAPPPRVHARMISSTGQCWQRPLLREDLLSGRHHSRTTRSTPSYAARRVSNSAITVLSIRTAFGRALPSKIGDVTVPISAAPADPAARNGAGDSLVVSENFARMMLANTNAGCRERRPAAFRDPTPAAGTRVHRDG